MLFCFSRPALSQQDGTEHAMPNHSARFTLRALGQRQKQLGERKGFLNLSMAIGIRELAKSERENERRRFALSAQFEPPLTTLRYAYRGRSLSRDDGSHHRDLKIEFELPAQGRIRDLVEECEPASKVFDC